MTEIYGLCDPQSGEMRYIGKAKDAISRHKRHLTERHLHRPVNKWVNSLLRSGQLPALKILAVVPDAEWEQWERDLIAEFRKTHQLLNLADGGAMPSQTVEQRKQAAKASNTAQSKKSPAWKAHVKAKQDLARLHARFSRDTKSSISLSLAAKMRFMMRLWAADKPEYYGAWASL